MKRRVAEMEEEAAKIEQIQQETNKALVKPSGRATSYRKMLLSPVF